MPREKTEKTPNEIELIQRANAGDAEAARTLKSLRDAKIEVARASGIGRAEASIGSSHAGDRPKKLARRGI